MELYAGALANFGANWLGNYPWFATYNSLQASVPRVVGCCTLNPASKRLVSAIETNR